MGEKAFETIKDVLALEGDAGKLSAFYAGWADRYDADLASEQYRAPAVTADLASFVAHGYLHRAPKAVTSLDAGCGTGLVGVEMKRRGFGEIDGFDLSAEMTEGAAQTGAYRTLTSGVDLNVDHPNAFGLAYDLLVCCGVLTVGHVKPESLRRLAEYLAPGGVMIVSTRKSYLADGAFEETAARLEREGWIDRVGCLPDAWYIAEEPAHYWIFRRPG